MLHNLRHLHLDGGYYFTEMGFVSLFNFTTIIFVNWTRFVSIRAANLMTNALMRSSVGMLRKRMETMHLFSICTFLFSCSNIESLGIFDCHISVHGFAMIADRLRFFHNEDVYFIVYSRSCLVRVHDDTYGDYKQIDEKKTIDFRKCRQPWVRYYFIGRYWSLGA